MPFLNQLFALPTSDFLESASTASSITKYYSVVEDLSDCILRLRQNVFCSGRSCDGKSDLLYPFFGLAIVVLTYMPGRLHLHRVGASSTTAYTTE